MISLILYTKPVPINQKYFVRNGRNILSNKYREAKRDLQLEIQSQYNAEPLGKNVSVNIIQYFGDKRKHDVDNSIKILLDSLSNIVYIDDSQVTELHVFKEYSKDNPRTLIQIL